MSLEHENTIKIANAFSGKIVPSEKFDIENDKKQLVKVFNEDLPADKSIVSVDSLDFEGLEPSESRKKMEDILHARNLDAFGDVPKMTIFGKKVKVFIERIEEYKKQETKEHKAYMSKKYGFLDLFIHARGMLRAEFSRIANKQAEDARRAKVAEMQRVAAQNVPTLEQIKESLANTKAGSVAEALSNVKSLGTVVAAPAYSPPVLKKEEKVKTRKQKYLEVTNKEELIKSLVKNNHFDCLVIRDTKVKDILKNKLLANNVKGAHIATRDIVVI